MRPRLAAALHTAPRGRAGRCGEARTKTALSAVFVLALAGCAGAPEAPPQEAVAAAAARDTSALAEGMGAVAGLLVDDRYRPLAGGHVLLQELGRTTSSDAEGLFAFLDVRPGTYTLKADVPGHEAVPETVEVAAARYAELDLVARRVESANGTIITQEYSVFIPCAADYVLNGGNPPCTLDLSDDSYSSAFVSNLTGIANVTYVVTEFKAQRENRYEVQIRNPGTPYAVARFAGDYVRIVLQLNVTNREHPAPPEYGETVAWNNTRPFRTIFFVDHEHRETVTGAWPANPGVPEALWPTPCCGAGFSAGVRAKFVQSVFVGEPEVDIATYRVYN